MEILKKAYFFVLDLMQTILLAASIFLVIYLFFFRPFQVSGESMDSTFKNKEYILTNIIAVKLNMPINRGDVIVFKAPTDKDKDFIKRVIGIPGDTVMVQNGYVFVNGKQIHEEEYLDDDIRTYGGSYMADGEIVRVPEGQYIVMGDNRPFSSDSREWGPLKKEDIIGKSFFVYWPANTMRLITNPHPESEQK